MVALVQLEALVLCQLNNHNRLTTCIATSPTGSSFEITFSSESFSVDEVTVIHRALLNLVEDLNRQCKWDLGRFNGQLILKPSNWNITAFYPVSLDQIEPTIREYYAQFRPRPVSIESTQNAETKSSCRRCKEGCRH